MWEQTNQNLDTALIFCVDEKSKIATTGDEHCGVFVLQKLKS
jgi:hypothetical protein